MNVWMGAALVALLGSSILGGCGGDEGSEIANIAEAEGEPEVASIVFDEAWNESQSGALIEGGVVEVTFDPARLETCEGVQGGIPQWAVTGHWRLGDEAGLFDVISPNRPDAGPVELELAAAGTLELWFEATNVWGCHEWDSNFGDNYRFEVQAAQEADEEQDADE